MSDSHYRQECEHGVVVGSCRCPGSGKRLEIVRPCPQANRHLGWLVKHPLPPAAAVGDGLGQVPQDQAESLAGGLGGPGGGTGTPEDADGDLSGLGRAFKLCLFRSCAWAISEPEDLLGLMALDAEIAAHLRQAHGPEIELMARTIG